MSMYYVIKHTYVGPNQDQEECIDADTIEICTTPALTNSSHEERIEGWCGTTDDWSLDAYGEYESLAAARDAIRERFGPVRDSDAEGHLYESDDVSAVEVYKPGQFTPVSRAGVGDWLYYSLEADITEHTTDDQIADLAARYETEANGDGYTLSGYAEDLIIDYRRGLIEEAVED